MPVARQPSCVGRDHRIRSNREPVLPACFPSTRFDSPPPLSIQGEAPGRPPSLSVDLDHDSPHVLISAGAGGGKSTILRCITCQFVHNGALAEILFMGRQRACTSSWSPSPPPPAPLGPGGREQFSTPTTPPSWSTTATDGWHRDYAKKPVRLSITARSRGSEWTVPLKESPGGLVLVGRWRFTR